MPSAVPSAPRVSRLIVGGAAAMVAALLLVAAAAALYVSAARRVEHTRDVQSAVDAWTLTVLQVQTASHGFVVSGRPEFLGEIPRLLARERGAVAVLRRLVADNPQQLAAVERADREAQAALAYFQRESALVQSGEAGPALEQLNPEEGRHLTERFGAAALEVRAGEQRLLAERRRVANQRAWATLAGAVLAAGTAFGLLRFTWIRELKHVTEVGRMARQARERLRALSDLAAALADARTSAQVAEVVVDHGLRAAGGDTCTLYGLDERGETLELLGQRGVDAELIEKLRTLSATEGNPETFRETAAGRSVWVESEADYLRRYPKLAGANVPGRRAKSFWSVPLVAEGQSVGLLGVGFFEPRSFSADDRAFVDTLARQCAQALLRASRSEAEDATRRWFSTTLRSIGDAVIATNERGRVTFMNPVAERLTGWSEAEALSQPLDAVFCIISEATRTAVESPVTKVLREGKVVGLANHTLLLPKTGPEIPIDDSGAPIKNEAGQIVGVVLVFRDVTLEKGREVRNEFLVRASEALGSSLDYQTTLASVARSAVPQLADWCAVDLVDPDTARFHQVAVAHTDPAKVRYAEELGKRYPPPQDAPNGVAQVIRSGKSELYAELPQELLEAGARDAEHLRIIRELQLKSAMVVPLRAHDKTFGAMTFVYADSDRRYTGEDLAFAEDLAQRAALAIENALALRATEEARKREHWLREEAERTNRLKDEFLATASHELRTPLNAILGWTLTLQRSSINPETDRALTVIERNARAQAKLIEDVLDVSRIVSGKLALHLGPASVVAAARAAIETITPAAEAKGISLVAETVEEPSTITADADRLQQIIWNLLSNAVKFTPKDGKIFLRVYRDASDFCVSVKDNGEGIRRDLLRAIFEPFQQADASTTRRHGGLGLGLSIAQQLVAAHGGSIAAESDGPGTGATFTVRLPIRAVTAKSDESSPTATADYDPLVAISPNARLDGLRVLVIDDEMDARNLVQEILRQHGAEVFVASSAAQAREQLAVARPDVIVSDIGMPEEDGYAFIRSVRAHGGRVPAVALTAYASQQDAQRAFVAGFQKHVTKPVEPTRLVSVVANLGGRSL